MNKLFVLIFLIISTLVSAISVELVNGRIIEAELIKVLENEIYLEIDKTLIIIDKEFISAPEEYKNSSFTENEKHKINYNSYIIVNINSAEDLDFEISNETKQNFESKNNFGYVELGGSGYLYSFNFEKRIYKSYSVKVGASVWQFNFGIFGSFDVIVFPVALLKTFGKGPVKLELGGGVSFLKVSHNSYFTLLQNNDSHQSVIGNASTTIRFEPYPFPLIFKIGCTSLITNDDFKFMPSICVGSSF